MQIGKLSHYVRLQSAAQSQGATGAVTKTWSTYHTAWAAIEPLSGREYEVGRVVMADADFRVTVRYVKIGITPHDRVLYGDRTFDIVSVVNKFERDRWFVLYCKEDV